MRGLLGSLHSEKPQIESRGRWELKVSVQRVLNIPPPKRQQSIKLPIIN